jgi:hypothetical protein
MTGASNSRKDSQSRYAAIPASFPRPKLEITGLQPLFSTVAYNRTYYPPGCTPPAIYERWATFEEIARALSITVAADRRAQGPTSQRTKVLGHLLQKLLKADIGSAEEMRWVGHRAGLLLGFKVPEKALPARTTDLPAPMNAWTVRRYPGLENIVTKERNV